MWCSPPGRIFRWSVCGSTRGRARLAILDPDPSGTTTWQVDLAECGSGDAEVRGTVYWRDTFNRQHGFSTDPVPVVLANAPRLEERSGANQTVTLTSPGQVSDGGWTLRCYHRGEQDLPVTAQILDSSGTVVRTLQDDEVCRSTSSSTTCTSPGSTPSTTPTTEVPDGDYTFRAEVTNTYGTSTYDTPVIVDTRVPGAITTPEPGVELSGTVDVVFTAGSDLPLERVRLYGGVVLLGDPWIRTRRVRRPGRWIWPSAGPVTPRSAGPCSGATLSTGSTVSAPTRCRWCWPTPPDCWSTPGRTRR